MQKLRLQQAAKEEFRKQVKSNELLMKVGIGANSVLMGTEEVNYAKALGELQA